MKILNQDPLVTARRINDNHTQVPVECIRAIRAQPECLLEVNKAAQQFLGEHVMAHVVDETLDDNRELVPAAHCFTRAYRASRSMFPRHLSDAMKVARLADLLVSAFEMMGKEAKVEGAA